MEQECKKQVRPAIGIDLGTTYSCVAVFHEGRVEVIANSQGDRITPSVVAFTEKGRVIGEGAEIHRSLDPRNTIYNAKRFIGRKWEEQAVQESVSKYPFKVNEKDKKVEFEVGQGPSKQSFRPEEISASILAHMKKMAEDYLEEEVKDAVITVPAYFTDSQRKATKDAGQIAGLNVTRIINEPTAASLVYNLQEKSDKDGLILVYDLGGGTFDVSLLQVEEDILEVKATCGDTNLGGDDFTTLIVRHFKKEIFREHGIDLTPDHKAVHRLTKACEILKRNLSADSTLSSYIELEAFLPGGKTFKSSMTRAWFENICGELFKKTLKDVEKVLEDAEVTKGEIDEVVLVGGSTRIPKIQSLLIEMFPKKPLNKSINPDGAVVCGAAIQAAILNHHQHKSIDDLLLMDVTPLSLAVSQHDGTAYVVIKRNTPIPFQATSTARTVLNNQRAISITITEGIYYNNKLKLITQYKFQVREPCLGTTWFLDRFPWPSHLHQLVKSN